MRKVEVVKINVKGFFVISTNGGPDLIFLKMKTICTSRRIFSEKISIIGSDGLGESENNYCYPIVLEELFGTQNQNTSSNR